MKLTLISALLFLLISFNLSAQNSELDSLRNSFYTTKIDSVKYKSGVFLGRNFLQINLDSSLKYFDIILKDALRLNEYRRAGAAETYNGIIYENLGDSAKTLNSRKRAIKYYVKANDDRGQVIALHNLATFYRRNGINDAGIEFYQKALPLALKTEDYYHLNSSYSGLVTLFIEKQDYKTAMEFAILALENAERNFPNALADSYTNIGFVHDYMNSKKEALKYFELGINAVDTINRKNVAIQILSNMAYVYIELDSLESARKCADKIQSYINNTPQNLVRASEQLGLPTYHLVYSLYFQNKKEYNKAIINAKKVLEYLGVYINNNNQHSSYRVLANSYTQLYKENREEVTNLDSAIHYGEIGIKFAETIESSKKQYELTDDLIRIYTLKGDLSKAEYYYSLRQELSSKLEGSIRTKAILELEDQYQSEKKELQIQLLEEQKATEVAIEKQKTKYTGLIAGLVGLLLIVAIFAIVLQRKQSKLLSEKNGIIEKSLNEKQLLLKEIHHRVKNNFQVVTSLLELQSRNTDDPKTIELAAEGSNRVKSMALIHEKLYQNDDLEIQFETYTKSLVDEIAASFKGNKKAAIKYDMADMYFDVDTAVPLGLILNELITNAFKYGNSNENPEVQIKLSKENEEYNKLEVKDNGDGMQSGMNVKMFRSLGLSLVSSLAKQLQGELQINSENGAAFTILFKDTLNRNLVD